MELSYEKCQSDLQNLLQARYPLIFLRSTEEERAMRCAVAAHLAVAEAVPQDETTATVGELARWSSVSGFERYTAANTLSKEVVWERTSEVPDPKEDPIVLAINALRQKLDTQVTTNPEAYHTYLLPDWSTLVEPDCHRTARLLKELIIAIENRRPLSRMSLVVIGAEWSIPRILRNYSYIVELPFPTAEELSDKVFSRAERNYGVLHQDAKELAEQAQGMTLRAAGQTAKLASAQQLWNEPDKVKQLLLDVKKQEIKKTGVLEYFTPTGGGLSDVGGLDVIKQWVIDRKIYFQQDARPELRPRAILLEGYPGCGKSFIAKAIAQEWGVPQINFEISRLQSKWIGESESNTFQALRAIEASAPNILFMDEIEKAFSGVGGDSSGVSTRQFGTFLSWLNDHRYPIFFIATSNNRAELPPELFRAGRFDEVFIVMPPNTEERRDIIKKRIAAYRIKELDVDTLEFLVESTIGFSGAELDKLVREAIYIAGLETPILEQHCRQARARINPQFKMGRMQDLLKHYKQQIAESAGKLASREENGFWKELLKDTTK